jgi:hypothetical protein
LYYLASQQTHTAGASVADRFSTSVPVVILLVDFFGFVSTPKRGLKRADFRSQIKTIVMSVRDVGGYV